ncbi:GNAT family N-acetyltransferase [Aquihabitans sp. G128]|uniref:GNAT family N-acetyltransferase n=1 Tax=Aquihabitans sp. G128 TaxID=2849779 RepID=UPI001C22BC7E|nr:GNAT family N-acetyltransferase [Aquihabitans sp. G128]QXC59838.1 GNAT family N-acetyltransferase [Aquihabitans sp. G128]
MIDAGGDRRALQVSTWRGDQRIAVLSPAPERPGPGIDTVAAEVHALRLAGFRRVLTGALHQAELGPFLANGFEEHERLHLLRHELLVIPDAPEAVRLRRGWRRDQPAVLDIDHRAFDAFWALDRRGLDDAVRATPVSRFRVSTDGRGPITGYAVTGRAADRGYLQRLAVDPAHHRAGIGRALVADCLTWLRRSGARAAVVNTQERNAGALALYRDCGFVPEPAGLTVLTLDLGGEPDPSWPPHP